MRHPPRPIPTGLILAGLCLMGSGALAAQTPALTIRPGAWRLEGASEGEPVCVLRLMDTETIGGKDVAVSDDCRKSYPWTADIIAWYAAPGPHGDLKLIDGERHVVIRFSFVDGDAAYGGMIKGFDYTLYPPLPAKALKKQKKANQ